MNSFGTIVVVGGGCYGRQYVRQLRRARAAGKAEWERVIVVDHDPTCAFAKAFAADPVGASDLNGPEDRWAQIDLVQSDWAEFFADWLDAASEAPAAHLRDTIVPSPLMPHLLYDWILGRARERWPEQSVMSELPDELESVPWQKAGGDGTRYASYATWICPINCIEPAKCPHSGGPRDWSFHDSLTVGGAATAILKVTHRQYGVGMIDVADVIAADALVAERLPAGEAVRIATASHCHGAVASLRLA